MSEGLASFAAWPSVDQSMIDIPAEIAEELLVRTVEDIDSILRILRDQPRKITLCIAPDWKWEVFSMIAKATDKKNVIRDVMHKEEIRSRGKEAADAVKQCAVLYHKLPTELVEKITGYKPNELEIFTKAATFLSKEYNLEIEVVPADASGHTKAGSALPYKPAIIIE
jgi:leucyl-tRNA synthetase